MVIKIALRNFSKHWKISLLAILGTFVATMLLVGGLSLNDSVSYYLNQKLSKNFGKIDLVIRDKADTIFLPKAINVSKIGKVLKNFKEIKDFVPVKLAQIRANINGKYVDLYAMAVTKELERYIGRKVTGITISNDTAKTFNIAIGQKIEIITAKGSYNVEIQSFGEGELNFRGETASGNGTIFLPEDLFEEFGLYTLKEPNVYLVTLDMPVESHKTFAHTLAEYEGSIRVNAVKHRLATSPLSKIIGYLFIGFSGFSVISSFLFIASFYGILTEERKGSLGVLRAIGYSRGSMFSILFLEGFIYLIISEIVGAAAGLGFGVYLLEKINSFRREDELFAFVQDKIPFYITPQSVFYAVLIAAFVPVLILVYKSIEFSNVSPSILYTGRDIEEQKRKVTFKKIIYGSLMLIFLLYLYNISYKYFLLGILIIVPLIYRNSLILSFYGLSILLSNTAMLSTGTAKDMLIRAAFSLVGSIYLVFGFLPYIKKILERFKSIPTILAISYIEKHKNRNFAIFIVYSVTLILILISAVIPTSISKYIESKKDEGAFGYNFIIIENPLKTFFGSYKYLNDETFAKKFEALIPVQLVEVTFPGQKTKHTFIVSDEKIFKHLILPSEKLMKEIKYIKPEDIPDKSVYISQTITKSSKGEHIKLTLKGVLPGISPKITEEFMIKGLYNPVEALLPMDGIIIWRNRKFFGAISGYVGIIKDKKLALEAQEFVARKFDGAFYITGEIEKLYTSIDNLVELSLQLFYLGFFAGFAGLAIITFRNVYVRKKHIGMLRAIGSSSGVIFKMFIYESLMVVIIATIVALLSSTLIIRDLVNFVSPLLPSFKVVIPLWKVGMTLLSVFGLTIIFVSIPANISQKIPPSEALRVFD
ncbi:MAG: FtsX-like permease family protein [Fervidobacterium sp.]|nr:FtsX-like permease family protein [Fervidobacterium sp.]